MTTNQFNWHSLNIQSGANKEQARHNQVMEALESGKLDETKRHQMAQEANENARNIESQRHNLASEANAFMQTQLDRAKTDSQVAKQKEETNKIVSETSLLGPEYRLKSRDTLAKEVSAQASADSAAASKQQADVAEKRWMTETVLDAGRFATGALTSAFGAIAKLI